MRRIITLLLVVSCCAPAFAESVPKGPYRAFIVATRNIPQAQINGMFLPAPGRAQGTIFMCHGFRNRKELLVPYEWIRNDLGWNMILFDFRGHGQSPRPCGQLTPTLGYYEQWDLKAMIDWAEANRLPRPYVCMGVSMGASIALRWAGQDQRISGVLAHSPFKTGWDAVHQFRFHGHSLSPLPSLVMHRGLKRLLKDVDIPRAVSQRDDLRIWITVGQRDWFPVEAEFAILAASPAPEHLKRLVVIPDAGHAQNWKWAGNDPLIKAFLSASRKVIATR